MKRLNSNTTRAYKAFISEVKKDKRVIKDIKRGSIDPQFNICISCIIDIDLIFI